MQCLRAWCGQFGWHACIHRLVHRIGNVPEPLRITTFTHVAKILKLVQHARSWLFTSSSVNIRLCPSFPTIRLWTFKSCCFSIEDTYKRWPASCKECSTQSSRVDAHTGAMGSAGMCWCSLGKLGVTCKRTPAWALSSFWNHSGHIISYWWLLKRHLLIDLWSLAPAHASIHASCMHTSFGFIWYAYSLLHAQTKACISLHVCV